MHEGGSRTRPTVLEAVTVSQMEELESHFYGGDRDAWNRLVDSYGWSGDDAQAVWDWFGNKAGGGADPQDIYGGESLGGAYGGQGSQGGGGTA